MEMEMRIKKRVFFSRFWRTLFRNRLAVAGLVMVTIIVLMSICAPFITRYEYDAIDLKLSARPPSLEHIMGTDRLGRDIFCRLLYGGRISLLVAVSGMFLTCLIGISMGALAGYFGGKLDVVFVKLGEIFLSVPQILLILTIASIFGPSTTNLILFLGLTSWSGLFRITRGQYLSVKNRDFIQAARSLGVKDFFIMFKHILPNSVAPIVVNATLLIAQLILIEAGLSFLGLGVQQPTPSWGNILTAAQRLQVITNEPWQWVPAGGLISIMVLSVNFLGDGLRDALDPYKIV